MMPELEKRLQEREVPWDEIRERRVMERVLNSRGTGQKQNAPRMPRRRWAPLVIAASVAAAVATGWMSTADDGTDRAVSRPPSGDADDRLSTLKLADVGEALLSSGAVVRLAEQRVDETTVSQARGKVSYRIAKQQNHQVVIHAAGVRVRVVGTQFTVDIRDRGVSVSVTEGAVSVEDGEQAFTLRAGERISVMSKARERFPGDGTGDIESREASAYVESESVPLFTDGETDDGAATTRRSGELRYDSDTPAPIRIVLDKVDRLRRNGAFGRAALELKRIISDHPEYKDIATVWFTMGNVERVRGRHLPAATAYRKCHRLSPNGPLAEDALAESAVAFFAADEKKSGESAARTYLEKYPDGCHKDRLLELLAVNKEDDTSH